MSPLIKRFAAGTACDACPRFDIDQLLQQNSVCAYKCGDKRKQHWSGLTITQLLKEIFSLALAWLMSGATCAHQNE